MPTTVKKDFYARKYSLRDTEFNLYVSGFGKAPNRFYKVVRSIPNLTALADILELKNVPDEKIGAIILGIIRAEPNKDETKVDLFERILTELGIELVEYSDKEVEAKTAPRTPQKEYFKLDL